MALGRMINPLVKKLAGSSLPNRRPDINGTGGAQGTVSSGPGENMRPMMSGTGLKSMLKNKKKKKKTSKLAPIVKKGLKPMPDSIQAVDTGPDQMHDKLTTTQGQRLI
jgi:hypothetical protein